MAKGTVNKIILIGRLGQDPEVSRTGGGNAVARLSIATNELGKKGNDGKREMETEWHRCVVFGTMAENAAQYLSKGSKVYLEGRLKTNKWQDKNTGEDRYSTDILCNDMQFLEPGNKTPNQNQGFNQPPPQNQGFNQQTQPTQQQGFNQPPPAPASVGFDDFDDDLPF
jgi:single-strand DNA-binding protein